MSLFGIVDFTIVIFIYLLLFKLGMAQFSRQIKELYCSVSLEHRLRQIVTNKAKNGINYISIIFKYIYI